MKKCFYALMAFALLFACTPEENNTSGTNEQPGGGKDNTVHVTGISIDRSSVTLKEGESVTLVATVTPDNAENKNFTWSSSSDAVATVDITGKVTGIKAGSTTITATAEDGGKKASCAITVEANSDPSVTVGVDEITALSAVLHGKANLGTSSASDLKLGFQYSKSAGILPSNSTTVEVKEADASYNYSARLTAFTPETKYYFRSFVYQDGQYTYGQTKEFVTNKLELELETLDATDITTNSAVLNAKVDISGAPADLIKHGFYYVRSHGPYKGDGWISGKIEGTTMTAVMDWLAPEDFVYYCAVLEYNGGSLRGEEKDFFADAAHVESVTLDKKEYTFDTIGRTLTLKANVLPDEAKDKSVVWSSDNEDVATVDANGKVTAVGNGSATITVTTKDQEKTASCVITVAQKVTGISLDKSSIKLYEDQEEVLTPIVLPDNAADKSLTWTSDNTDVAAVDANGKVTAINKGTATIRAEANDGSGKYATCYVTVKRPVASILLDKTALNLYRGNSSVTEPLTPTVSPSDASDTGVSWSSSNTSVATVSSSGMVTGISRGNATITATARDGNGAVAMCEVSVIQYATSISINSSSISLVIGEEAELNASISPDDANDQTVTWSSSDDVIAVVDNTGKVTAKAKGKATITATANDGSGINASCSIVVRRNPCPAGAVDLGLSVYWATCNLCESGFVGSPEEYGDYYAWGELEAKETYTGGNYTYKDNPLTLPLSADVANKILGGRWRMPTGDEIDELVATRKDSNYSWSWQSVGGHKGWDVTYLVNGNSISLPAAGHRYGSGLFYAGSVGYYRSSSLLAGGTDGAWNLCFSYDTVYRGYYDRYDGLSVRPVSE